MTLTQKILAQSCGLQNIQAGQLIKSKLNLVLGNDVTTPVAIREMEKANLSSVFDNEKIALVLDHFTPNKDIQSAEHCAEVRRFAKKHEIKHFYDVGEMGIEHVILPEKGLIAPSEVIIGADSHTCTYGALGAFSTGVGSTDMAAGMATGEAWFKVPEAIKVTLTGNKPCNISGKDIVLYLIGQLGVDGANYCSLEFFGAENLTMDDRFTISNMAIECGAKNGIFPVDDKTREYLKNAGVVRDYTVLYPDDDAEYKQEIVIDLATLKPIVACPNLPSNVKNAEDLCDVKLNQVVIGSCTNGRISDLRISAEIMKNKKVAKDVRCIIIPGSQKVYLEALKEGLLEIFINAGAIVSTPTCGPCLGGHMGILAKGEVSLATTNRNFTGRMGSPQSFVYLSSPYVAAVSAINGYISEVLK